MIRSQPLGQKIPIVGGSAAGLFTAYLLARAGRAVRVLEGEDRLDPLSRTLIVTDRFREIVGDLGKPAVINEIRRFELFTDGRVATVELRRPDLVIERAALIRSLAGAAQQAGAEISLGRRLVSIRHDAKGLSLAIERRKDGVTEEVRAPIVIGADGSHSRVAKEAGWPAPTTVPLVQAIVPLPAGMRPDTTRVWFIPQDTPYFYWLIPESPTRGVLGLIGAEASSTRRLLDRFLEKQRLTPLEFQAAKIPVYTGWVPIRRQLAGGEVYLVGDAAGHVKVTTIGGIVTGFRGALGVAEAILHGEPGRRLHALRRELNLHLLIRKLIHGFTQAHYSHLVDLLNARARNDLAAHTRDEPGRVLWRLCLHQPRFLLLGLRALLSGGSFPSS